MARQNSLQARFYSEPEKEGAREPVREWLRDLPEEERIEVGADIRIVQNHWPNVKDVKPQLVESVRDGIWEIRTNLTNHWHRVYFAFLEGEILLLHAVKKKTNKAQKEDIDLALKRFSKAQAASQKK